MSDLVALPFNIPNVVAQSPNVIYKNPGVDTKQYHFTKGRLLNEGAFLKFTTELTPPAFQENTFNNYNLPAYLQILNATNTSGVKV